MLQTASEINLYPLAFDFIITGLRIEVDPEDSQNL